MKKTEIIDLPHERQLLL